METWNGKHTPFTDAMGRYPEISDMASRAILCFGGDDGSNMEGLGSIGVNVFSIVLINRVDDNKDYFEDEDYNMPIYNFCPGCTFQHTREDATALSHGCIRPEYNLKHLVL